MKIAPLPPDEELRLQSLFDLAILDTPAEEAYDKLTRLAASLCGTEISVVSLVDSDRQWFKSKVGLEVNQTPRDVAFCAHAILKDELMEVSDAQADPRFAKNPLVTGNPNIRFYAGVPLHDQNGMALGTLCVIDSEVKVLEDYQRKTLVMLAKKIEDLILSKKKKA